MRLPNCLSALLLACTALPVPALADDPRDPEMQTPEAIARDREVIRMLNRDMLAQVTERDRRYARGWREYELSRQGRHPDQLAYRAKLADYQARLAEYEANRARFTDNQAQYRRAMAAWREDVAACRTGIYEACAGY